MLSFEEDHWLSEKKMFEPRWIVGLTNGQTVFQDDARDGSEPSSAWLRLGEYCKRENVGISFMRLQFRTICVDVGRDADAFFFCKSFLGGSGGDSFDYYVAGTVKNGILTTMKLELPSLVEIKKEVRDIEISKDFLIWNPKNGETQNNT